MCFSIACTVNVLNALQTIAFHDRAIDDDDEEDESNWEMNLNDKDAVMQNNENDGESCAEVLNQNE